MPWKETHFCSQKLSPKAGGGMRLVLTRAAQLWLWSTVRTASSPAAILGCKEIQLSPKFSLAQAGPYSSFSMVVFAVLKPAWTSRFASSDSAGKHGIETKLWTHQCVKLKTLAPYKDCLTLQDFFLHIPVAPSSVRWTLVHTRCGISYWVRMQLMLKRHPNPYHLKCFCTLAWFGRTLPGTTRPCSTDFKTSNLPFHWVLTQGT